MVIGLSVLSRRVTHGTPIAVVSSCRPPLSVITTAASFHKNKDSLKPRGGRGLIFSDNFISNCSIIFLVLGCTGKNIGLSSAIEFNAFAMPSKVCLESTLDGRCRVRKI
jgi:hypothetical protein